MEEEKFYHIFNRGNNRENIFKEEDNYYYFLKQYEKYLLNTVDTYAYCLMPNHFHLLVQIKKIENKTSKALSRLTPAEKAFKDFFISYAKSINKKYGRTGSLFQYKFKRKEIKDEMYLKKLILYIHQNPVAAGFCEQLHEWKFSSFHALLSDSPTKLMRKEVIDWFEDKENFIYCHKKLVEVYEDY
ncbi:MAG: transposase [Bacteroidetes bacterium]|nr:transposase [Bacteroidota bacterium]